MIKSNNPHDKRVEIFVCCSQRHIKLLEQDLAHSRDLANILWKKGRTCVQFSNIRPYRGEW